MLEVIALHAADAEAAQAGGAHRLELTADMAADGLTPPVSVLRDVLSATDLPVRVMLRDAPSFAPGNLDRLRRDAAALREAGASEFVLGFLDARARVDEAACLALLGELEGCAWTFHRALDNSADPEAAWTVVGRLGCDTVLTAGSPRGVADGFAVLERLAARQGTGTAANTGTGTGTGTGAGTSTGIDEPDLRLLAGGGLKAEHVAPLKAVGVTAFHVGSAVRPHGWDAPLSADAVRTWASLV